MKEKEYDVALSFAGKDRHHAERLAKLLDAGGYSVFYDEFERAQLWGKDLYQHFSKIYKDLARYCVVFLSKHYVQRLWPQHELQSAQARAFEENQEYILPVRLDDADIPGILDTIGYVDLDSMSIDEIYQALVKKLSVTTPRTTKTDTPTSAPVTSDSGEFSLLLAEDGKLYFVPFQNLNWDSTEISLELLPESSEDAAFLRSLRENLSNRFAGGYILAFALGDDAAWVSPKRFVQTTSSTRTIWKVVLEENVEGQYQDPFEGVTFGDVTPDQIAEMRARRILLNEKLQSPSLSFNRFDQEALEDIVSWAGSAHNVTGMHIVNSPIPDLYRSYGQTVSRFEKFARLASILYLKLSKTVEDVLQLDLKLLNTGKLQVRFIGRRPKGYGNTQPTIQVEGVCFLRSQTGVDTIV